MSRPTGRPRGTYTVSTLGMARPPKAEVAWAAGLFEGEGSVVLTPWGVRLQIKMTDEDVLQHFRAILGGNINGPYQYNVPGKPARKQFWFWSLGGPAVLRVCRLLEPWMGKRRRERMEQLGMFTQQQFEFADDYLEDEES